MRYVVAARLAAFILVIPAIYIIGLAFHYLGNWMILIVQIGEVSQGGWETVHWMFTNPADIVASFLKVFVEGVVIVILAMYYGYNAKGGPVGVGTATARSMILNLIMVHIIGSLGTMIFWGVNPHAPVGG